MAKTHLQVYNQNKNINKYYRISPRRNNYNFNKNDYVKNNNDLYGIIQEKNNNYMIINWNDNTYERIQLPILDKNYLIRISKKEYVDTIESQVSPLQTSTINTASKNNNNKIQYLIDLAIKKGVIDSDEIDTEKIKLAAFDEQALKQLKLYNNFIYGNINSFLNP